MHIFANSSRQAQVYTRPTSPPPHFHVACALNIDYQRREMRAKMNMLRFLIIISPRRAARHGASSRAGPVACPKTRSCRLGGSRGAGIAFDGAD